MVTFPNKISQKNAEALYRSEFWKILSCKEIAQFQLHTDRLCMPFDVFQDAVAKALNRPVFTHEFGCNVEGLRNELMNGSPPPSLSDIVNMIPEDKRCIVVV